MSEELRTEAEVARRYLAVHPEEAAVLLEERPLAEVSQVLASCGPEVAGGVLRRMRTALASDVLGQMSAQQAGALAEALPLGDAARLLRGVDAGTREALLASMGRERRRELEALLRFPEHTAGALMDPRVASLPGDLSASEAAARLRVEPAYGAYYLYVVDREQRLVGVLSYRDLVRAEPAQELCSFMRPATQSILAESSGTALVEHPGWRGFLALPVVDERGVLLGALRHEVVVEAGLTAADTADPVASHPASGVLRRLWRRLRRSGPVSAGREPR